MRIKSVVFYAEWADQIMNLPDQMAGEYVKAILRYAFDGEDSDINDPCLKAMLVPTKKRIDEDIGKYQAKAERARMLSERNRNDVDTKSKQNRDDVEGINININRNINIKDKKKSSFRDFAERKIDYEGLMNVRQEKM